MGAAVGAVGLRRLPEVIAACLMGHSRDGFAGSGGFSPGYDRKRRQPSTVCFGGTLAILSHQPRRGRGVIAAPVQEAIFRAA